jgi:hypothetical protein
MEMAIEHYSSSILLEGLIPVAAVAIVEKIGSVHEVGIVVR